MALARAGSTVEAVCPTRHPLAKTRAVRRTFSYSGLAPLRSFASAIAATKPDLVIPGDDLATRHLHSLYHQARSHGDRGAEVCALIVRSLGAPESFPVEYARTTFMDVAREEGIRVPTTQVVANLDDLRKWIAQAGFPFVLKANGTSGGYGVRIVHSPEEAERALRTLHAPPSLARAAKRTLIDHDVTLVAPALLRRRPVVNGQTFVAGREATSAIACWQGAVLAALHFEVVEKRNSTGPATVVRLIENVEMSATAEKMVRRLHLSGLHGFDFMLEEQTGAAHLIEMNPRATQVGHLSLGPGRDIPAALYSALSGKPIQVAAKVTERDTIALFPQEWIRDPESGFLQSAYHDVPWEETELIQDCVRSRRKQSSWYSRRASSQPSPAAVRSTAPMTAPPRSRAVGLD
jgi:Carbamoyl-phosphate synthase L chain, ATP binding domain